MDGSSFAERISCLKFEPGVSNFPVIKATLGFYHQYYYEKSLWVVKHILEYVKDNDFSDYSSSGWQQLRRANLMPKI